MSLSFMELIQRTDEDRRKFEAHPKVLELVSDGLSVTRYRTFLRDLYHIVWNFNPICASAASRIDDSNRQVRYFLYEHMHEETGHEDWVINDLIAVGVDRETAVSSTPSVHALGLIGFNYYAADRLHPCSVLGMVYALEVIASVYGGPMAAAMKEALFLESDEGVSFISSHSTMDAEHMVELRAVINRIEDPQAREAITQSAIFNFHQFTQILEAV